MSREMLIKDVIPAMKEKCQPTEGLHAAYDQDKSFLVITPRSRPRTEVAQAIEMDGIDACSSCAVVEHVHHHRLVVFLCH